MKKVAYAVVLAVLAATAFVAGSWHGKRGGAGDGAGARKVLYYVDPMHPAYRSDKPGIAPDCGMQLEPVYADGGPAAQGPDGSAAAPGAVSIGPEKQQMVGVRVAPVVKAPWSHTLRVLGRVAPDERRVFVINATVDGWITRTRPNSTGSVVRKNEVLASFYSPEFLSAVQALLFALNSMDRVRTAGHDSPVQQDQMAQFNINLQQYKDSLRNLGMGERQVEELIRTRRFMESVDITSPADGFVLTRNVFDGLRFDKGAEMYRIADLSRVWVVADVFGEEANYLKPGLAVRASLPGGKTAFAAKVSDVLPRFDPATRTLKVRLEADNPGYVLRPEMFVDVELPISHSATVAVPADAVLDSGLRKTVYVDKGNGTFEPRAVETGWRSGDRVEIVRGLSPGERIVVSGNFLVDSESRMKAAAAGIYGDAHKDPVCGMDVDEGKARAAGRIGEHGGIVYYFCSDACKRRFDKDPARYTGKKKGDMATLPGRPAVPTAASAGPAPGKMRLPAAAPHAMPAVAAAAAAPHGMLPPPAAPHAMPAVTAAASAPVDPVCAMTVDEAEARAAGRVSEHGGKTYFFCADGCKRAFDADPARYLKESGRGEGGHGPEGHGGRHP